MTPIKASLKKKTITGHTYATRSKRLLRSQIMLKNEKVFEADKVVNKKQVSGEKITAKKKKPVNLAAPATPRGKTSRGYGLLSPGESPKNDKTKIDDEKNEVILGSVMGDNQDLDEPSSAVIKEEADLSAEDYAWIKWEETGDFDYEQPHVEDDQMSVTMWP